MPFLTHTPVDIKALDLDSQMTEASNVTSFAVDTLGTCGAPEVRLVQNHAFAAISEIEACNSITVGPAVLIEGGGDVLFRSPIVILNSGFSALEGSLVAVVNGTPAP